MQRTVIAVALAAMLTVAGCAGPGLSGGPSDGTSTDTTDGVVNMYVSDQPGAMDDFEHLNATVTKVALHKANATDDGNETAMNETETDETDEAESESDSEAEEFDPDGEDWVVKEIDDRRVDLSQLQGQNASRLGSLPVENGTYDKVFVFVEDANGTLTSGETTNVKIPSGRLQLNEQFTVGNGEEVDFVFDMTVVKAGNSGKYVLQPVVSESGTDVPFQTRDADGEGLDARFEGRVMPGEEATVVVTRQGQPVEGATVEVGDGEYTTDADGTVGFDVPEDAEELEVEIEDGEDETEIERKFPGAGERGPPEDAGDGDDSDADDDESERENGNEDEQRESDEEDGDEQGPPEDAGDDERRDEGGADTAASAVAAPLSWF